MDDITFRAATKSDKPPTASAILGPFWRADAPVRENGSSVSFNTPADGQLAFMYGQVTCAETGKPLANATVDIWQASTNGRHPTLADIVCFLRLLTSSQDYMSSRMKTRLIIIFAVSLLLMRRANTRFTASVPLRIP